MKTFEQLYPWFENGTLIATGLDGYPTYQEEPQFAIQLHINEILYDIQQKIVQHPGTPLSDIKLGFVFQRVNTCVEEVGNLNFVLAAKHREDYFCTFKPAHLFSFYIQLLPYKIKKQYVDEDAVFNLVQRIRQEQGLDDSDNYLPAWENPALTVKIGIDGYPYSPNEPYAAAHQAIEAAFAALGTDFYRYPEKIVQWLSDLPETECSHYYCALYLRDNYLRRFTFNPHNWISAILSEASRLALTGKDLYRATVSEVLTSDTGSATELIDMRYQWLAAPLDNVSEILLDGYPLTEADIATAIGQQHYKAILLEAATKSVRHDFSKQLKTFTAFNAILAAPAGEQTHVAVAACLHFLHLNRLGRIYNTWRYHVIAAAVTDTFLRKNLPFTEAQLIEICYVGNAICDNDFPFSYLISTIERYLKKHTAGAELSQVLLMLQKRSILGDKNQLKLAEILLKYNITTTDALENLWDFVETTDQWGEQVLQWLDAQAEEQKKNWQQLLKQCYLLGESNTTATEKFFAEVLPLGRLIGTSVVENQLSLWLAQVSTLRNSPKHGTEDSDYRWGNKLLAEKNIIVFRSLIWLIPKINTDTAPRLAHLVAKVAIRSFEKVPGVGPVAVKLGNGCIQTLAEMGPAGVAQLSGLKFRIKQSQTQQSIDRLIEKAAQQLNTAKEVLEDISVPDFNMVMGKLSEHLGEYQAVLDIKDSQKFGITWYNSEGKELKTVPAAVKTAFPDEYKSLQQIQKEAQPMLTAQKARFDSFYLAHRQWKYADFETRLLHHGLLSVLTQKLIWNFEKDKTVTPAFYIQDSWRTIDNQVFIPEADTLVSLWHPLDSPVAGVLAWRDFITGYEIVQPFKQAFREVYLVTDAEIYTHTYSNRFAAHIVRQHQVSTLAKTRGWSYQLLGAYDDGRSSEAATKNIPFYNLRAEFILLEAPNAGHDNFNDAGIWLHVATDRVQFLRNGQPLPLSEVPPPVFSEILREVDLFVGVGSIGNDPNWTDRGENPNWDTYWHTYSFGELSENAKTRKVILEKLLPKLKIAAQCTLQDKFLIVTGKLRKYKIHLGSGNILMEPNDQYLCIVPDTKAQQNATQKIYLPFEGDTILSIILSKAFLLANDDKITDTGITRQIGNQVLI